MSHNVETEYCVPCGQIERAADKQRSILERFGRRIDGIQLGSGESGVFTTRVGDEIFTKQEGLDFDRIVFDVAARI
jgi:selenoprotein W-related protein